MRTIGFDYLDKDFRKVIDEKISQIIFELDLDCGLELTSKDFGLYVKCDEDAFPLYVGIEYIKVDRGELFYYAFPGIFVENEDKDGENLHDDFEDYMEKNGYIKVVGLE